MTACHEGGVSLVTRSESQDNPGAKVCTCTEKCCNSEAGDCICPVEDRHACYCTHPVADTVAVPAAGTYLVVDGRVMKSTVDTQGYAGPQVHLVVTEEPWE